MQYGYATIHQWYMRRGSSSLHWAKKSTRDNHKQAAQLASSLLKIDVLEILEPCKLIYNVNTCNLKTNNS